MKKLLFLAFALFSGSLLFGQINPVKWTWEAKKINASEYDLVFTAHIENGWYVYSQFLESDEGPIPTSFSFEANPNLEITGKVAEAGHRHEVYDDIFAMNLVKFSGESTFTQRVKINTPSAISGYLEFMTCDNEKCLPPAQVEFRFSLN